MDIRLESEKDIVGINNVADLKSKFIESEGIEKKLLEISKIPLKEKHLSKKEKYIKQILEREEQMFKDVSTIEPLVCKKRLKTFRLMREAKFSSWSNRTLKGYLVDLKNAIQAKRNLVTERYAIMEKLRAFPVENKLIELIVTTEKQWFLELNDKYPHIMGNFNNFINYLKAELATYSTLTLKYYFEDIKQAKLINKNLIEKRFLNMYQKLGYASLQEVEGFYLKGRRDNC